MKRRELLRLAPLAALAVLPIKAEGATAYEVRKDKKYIFVFKPEEMDEKTADHFAQICKESGIHGLLLFRESGDLTIYEVEQSRK